MYPESVREVDPVAAGATPAEPPDQVGTRAMAHRLDDRSLLLIAPSALRSTIGQVLAMTALRVHSIDRPDPGSTPDPYGIGRALDERPAVDGVLLVVPADADLDGVVPGPLVDGVPVGVLRADDVGGLCPWLSMLAGNAIHAPAWAVCSMGTDEFLEPAGSLVDRLEGAGPVPPLDVSVADWRASRVGRPALCAGLASGPSLAVYLGHGRDRGWGGYQALRWTHVDGVPQEVPIGAVLSLSCDALGPTGDGRPFLERFVARGRAGAVLGPVGDVQTATLLEFVQRLGTVLRTERPATVGELLVSLGRTDADGLGDHLASYRLLGLPSQPIR